MHKEDKLLKVGILGCGPISQFGHFEACQKARNAELYAVCDVAEDLLKNAEAKYQPRKLYSELDQMLEDPQVEAVIVATSDAFHIPAAMKIVSAGKHVLVEKPISDSVEQSIELRKLLMDSGVTFQVGHMKRFDPGIAFAQKFIEQEIGELLAIKAWYCDSTHRYTMTDSLQPIPVSSNASLKPELDPKADKKKYFMMAHGSHLLDTAIFLGGGIISVQARLVEKFGAYSWFCDIEFENGAHGHLDLTIAVRMDWHEGFQIYGEFGSVLGKTYNPWYLKSSDVECFLENDQQYKRILGADAHFYKLQLEGFADTILHQKSQLGTDIDDAIEVVRGMIAIAKSVESGERIYLAEVQGIL